MEFEFYQVINEVKLPVMFHAGMVINGVKILKAGIEKTPDNKSKYYVILNKNDQEVAKKLLDHLIVEGDFDVMLS